MEQFFKFNQIVETEKIMLASYHMERESLQGFQWFEKSRGVVVWAEFVEALCTRFRLTTYEDYMGELPKLQQGSMQSIRDHQVQFKMLANRTKD